MLKVIAGNFIEYRNNIASDIVTGRTVNLHKPMFQLSNTNLKIFLNLTLNQTKYSFNVKITIYASHTINKYLQPLVNKEIEENLPQLNLLHHKYNMNNYLLNTPNLNIAVDCIQDFIRTLKGQWNYETI